MKQMKKIISFCALSLVLSFLGTATFAQGAGTAGSGGPSEAPTQAPANPMTAVYKVQFADEPFGTCLNYLKAMSGLTIAVNWEALKAAGVDKSTKINFKNDGLPFYLILQETIDRAGEAGKARLHYFASREYLVITSMKAYLKRQRYMYDSSEQSKQLVQALNQPLSVELKGKGAFDILSKIFLAKQMPMLVDEAAIKAAGVNLDALELAFTETPAKTVLELAFRQMEGDSAKITCNMRDGVLYVTSIDKAALSRIYWKDLTEESNAAFPKLAKRISVPNAPMNLIDLIEHISKETGVKLHVNVMELVKAKVDLDVKLKLGAITKIRGDELLRIGLELAGERLGYAMLKGHVFVSNHDEVKKLVSTTE